MGLLTIIRKNRLKEKEMRILFLQVSYTPSSCSPYQPQLILSELRWDCRGLDNAGKTTILKKLNGEDISTISPTLGFNIKSFGYKGYTLNVWDVGGQRTLRPYWRNYFEATDAVVWVVDSSDRMRTGDCKSELKELLQEDRLAGATLLIFANKQDLAGAMSLAEIRDQLDLPSIQSHTWLVQPCSAYTGDKLVDGLDWLVKDVASRVYYGTVNGPGVENEQRVAAGEGRKEEERLSV